MESLLPERISEETRVEQLEKLIELMGTGTLVHKCNKPAMGERTKSPCWVITRIILRSVPEILSAEFSFFLNYDGYI